ncbi:MAG: FAD-binding dehydrogenase [Bdellovibrionota bacterium]
MGAKNYQADCVVVGAGLSGIYACLKLLEAGKKVILLDRDVREHIGGQAVESFGGVFMADSPLQRRFRIKDDLDMAYSDWCSFAEFTAADELGRAWARGFIENSTRLLYHGLKKYHVSYFPVVHWVERGLFVPGNSVPRFHMVWGTGHGLIKRLAAALLAYEGKEKLQIYFQHNVKNFLEQQGKIVGVEGVSEFDQQNFKASGDNVIMAAGGYGANLDLVRKNWHRDWSKPPKDLLIGCHQFNDGQLHDQVKQLGGDIINQDRMWNYAAGIPHPHPKRQQHGLSLVPPKSALWMDALGKRIGPVPLITAFDTRSMVSAICKAPAGYSWQIMNRKIAVKELAVSGSEHNPAIRDEKLFSFLLTVLLGNSSLVDHFCKDSVHFVTAPNLQELVQKMNAINQPYIIEHELIKNEIETYDKMIGRGRAYFNDDQLRRLAQLRNYKGDRLRTCKFQKILDPSAGPLIAVKLNILVRKSLGGVKTNLRSQVLRPDNSLITGLYAVGESAGFGGGSIHGLRALEGTFLGNCIYNAEMAVNSILAGN